MTTTTTLAAVPYLAKSSKADAQLHPRLFFSAADLPEFRRKCQTGLRAEVLRHMRAFCDRILDPADDKFFDYRARAKPIWKERESIFLFRTCVPRLAWLYAMTGEVRYGQAARDATMTIIRDGVADRPIPGVFGVDENNRVYQGWRRTRDHQHDPGDYAAAICQAYDLCFQFFTDDDRKVFIQHASESLRLTLDLSRIVFYQYNEVNNRGCRAQIGVFGWLKLTLAEETQDDLFDKVFHLSIRAAESYLHSSWDQDGVPFEGPEYGSGLYIPGFFGHMLHRQGKPDLRRNPRFASYLSAILYELVPDSGSVNNLNDADWPTGFAYPALSLLDTDPAAGAILPWLLRQLELHPQRIHQLVSDVYQTSTAILLYWQEDAPIKHPRELGYPISHCFPQHGLACMRTGWDPGDYLLSHRCGLEAWNQHKQSDQNHVALYALGERFLIDEGYGQSSGLPLEPNVPGRYFSQADVHNTVIIDGRDMQGNQVTGGWAEGQMLDWAHTPEYDTSLGNAAQAYGPDHMIDRAMRRVVFVRAAPRPFALIVDDVVFDMTGQSHQYEALWRTLESNQLQLDADGFTIVGHTHDCCARVMSPQPVSLTQRLHRRRPQVIACVQAPQLALATLLMPTRRGLPPPQVSWTYDAARGFTIKVQDGDCTIHMQAPTAVHGVLKDPVPVLVRLARDPARNQG